MKEVEQYAARNGVKRLYLLTATAQSFFESLGYVVASREGVPDPIRATSEFTTLCSASAVVMAKAL